jgi:hypothetical protein
MQSSPILKRASASRTSQNDDDFDVPANALSSVGMGLH